MYTGVRSVPPPNHHCLEPGERREQEFSFIHVLNSDTDTQTQSLTSHTLTVFLFDLKVSVVEVHGGDVGVLGVDHRAHTHGTKRELTWGEKIKHVILKRRGQKL